MAIYGSEPISPLKGDAAMVTISLKSSIIISSWVQLALSHCPLNFLQIRFEMKTSLWKFIIATALHWANYFLINSQMSMMYENMDMDCCLGDQVWVHQSLPLSHDDCCQLSHDRQPTTCISLSSPLTVLAWVSIVTTLVSRGVRCEASKYAELLCEGW